MKLQLAWLALATCLLLTGACAIQQQQIVGRFQSVESEEARVLASAVTVKAKGAKKTTLQAGTRWTLRGEIPEGRVYSTADQVVIVESYNTREAYLVISDAQAVGFYLPVEHTFVKTESVEVQFQKSGEESE